MGAGSFILPSVSGDVLPDEGLFIKGGNLIFPEKYGVSTVMAEEIDIISIAGAPAGSGINTISVIFIKSDGTMWGIGDGDSYRLGNGSTGDLTAWTQIGVDTDWLKISLGNKHSVALKTDGTLWVTGDNQYGQVGDGNSPTDVQTWTQIGVDTDWEDISCGYQYSVAIKGGNLYSCGNNNNYKTGVNINGGGTISWTLIDNTGICSKVYASYQTSHIIKTDGTMWGFGYGNYYCFGNGSGSNLQVPTQIGIDTDWDSIFPTYWSTAAIKTDGTLYTSGYNQHGATGLGLTIGQTFTWTQIGVDTDWSFGIFKTSYSTVNFGMSHNYTLLAIKSGVLMGTGRNSATGVINSDRSVTEVLEFIPLEGLESKSNCVGIVNLGIEFIAGLYKN